MMEALGAGAAMHLVENLSGAYGSGRDLRNIQQQEDFDWGMRNREEDVKQRSALNMADISSRVEAAKAAGLHPLAALGINAASAGAVYGGGSSHTQPGSLSAHVRNALSKEELDANQAIRDANVLESQANARRANAEASIIEKQYLDSIGNTATQPGNPPIVQLEPNRVTMAMPGTPSDTGGIGPSKDHFMIADPYKKGVFRKVPTPSAEFGQRIENMGELWQAILAAPYALDLLSKKYLSSPREWLEDKSIDIRNFWQRFKKPKNRTWVYPQQFDRR